MPSKKPTATSRHIITVDGLAGSGKSTLARELAKRLRFQHLNSGLLYRALGLAALCWGLDPEDKDELGKMLDKSKVQCRPGKDGGTRVLLNKKDVTNQLHTLQVASITSAISAAPEVRDRLLTLQREAFSGDPVVAEGRDMGTVVFPDAPIKFYVVAPLEARAERRLNQLVAQGILGTNLREVEEELKARDDRDVNRDVAPAKPAVDAVEIDNGSRPLTDVLDSMYSLATLKIG